MSLEQFLRAIWNAISWATVLILPHIKLNAQLSRCAFFFCQQYQKCIIKLDIIQSISFYLPHPFGQSNLAGSHLCHPCSRPKMEYSVIVPTALPSWVSFVWPNFQLIPYISIFSLSSEKFSKTSMFLTSLLNISFTQWLELKAAVTPLRFSHFKDELFATSYHLYLRVQRFSHICFFRALPSLLVFTTGIYIYLQLIKSLSRGISDTWTTFTSHYKSSCLDNFNTPMDAFFSKAVPQSPHRQRPPPLLLTFHGHPWAKTSSTSAHLPWPSLGSFCHPPHCL